MSVEIKNDVNMQMGVIGYNEEDGDEVEISYKGYLSLGNFRFKIRTNSWYNKIYCDVFNKALFGDYKGNTSKQFNLSISGHFLVLFWLDEQFSAFYIE